MSEKSHVGMGYALCPVCGAKHDEVVLMDKRLRNSLNRENFTGWGMCPAHKRLRAEGYTALIVVTNKNRPTLENAERTGEVMHVRSSAWPRIFRDVPLPLGGISFVDVEAAEKLKTMMPEDA